MTHRTNPLGHNPFRARRAQLEQYRIPSMNLDTAYGAVRDWLGRAGVNVQRALAPVDGVVEFWAGNAVGRIKWSRRVLNQGAILALLRAGDTATDERKRRRMLFSLTGYTAGAISVANSQDVALFSVERGGEVIPINEAAVQMDPGPEPPPLPPDELLRTQQTVPDQGWISCQVCGITLHPDANYCAACGHDLHELTATAEEPAEVSRQPVPAAQHGTPQLQCRTCGSNDIELIQPT